MAEPSIFVAIFLLSLGLTAQGVFSLYLMLYSWFRPERLQAAQSPTDLLPPQLRFTVIIPARHEELVLAQTIDRVWSANYPKELLEVLVVCEHTDVTTIAEAERAIRAIDHPNVRLAIFSDGPINKPHGLNVALGVSRFDVVVVFDAEDDVHPDMFQIVNTIMGRSSAGIVQAGVQLIDFQSSWYAGHNVLEYFFWFKSRLHYHSQVGAVPLGGNTIFIRRELLLRVNGWDETCLTEDADIGIRLSALGEPIVVTYDAEHATREETPPTLGAFIRQRTRWNQGFLQVLKNGDWRRLPGSGQRLLTAYTLCYPLVQAVMGLLWMPALLMMLVLKAPVALAMFSLLPLYVMLFQYVITLCGLFEFARTYALRVRLRDVVTFTIGFLPYQAMLSVSAIRAVYRELRRRNNWEKTTHIGAHRQPAVADAWRLNRLLDERGGRIGPALPGSNLEVEE